MKVAQFCMKYMPETEELLEVRNNLIAIVAIMGMKHEPERMTDADDNLLDVLNREYAGDLDNPKIANDYFMFEDAVVTASLENYIENYMPEDHKISDGD